MSTTPSSTITTTNTPSSPPTPTTTTIPSINQIQRPEWATDRCDKILWKETNHRDEILRKEISKISQEKKIMTTSDLPGYNITGLYKLKYENSKQNSEIRNFQSHKNELCVPTDLTNIHHGNSFRDPTTTVSKLAPNKSIDITNNHRDNLFCNTTKTDPTHPTNKSNNTTTTQQ